jgi:hypothetical protein
MAEPWFHHRSGDEGTGYGTSNAKGASALVGVVLLTSLAVILPIMFGAGPWAVYFIGGSVAVLSIAALLVTVRRRSDWKG